MTDPSPPRTRRNRTALLVIVAIFFGGMLVAGALRFSGWRPAVNKNHGELLQPPADLRAMTPRLADGSVYAWKPKARTWRIALAPPAGCTDECDKLAHDIDVVTRLMGKNADKVDVLWLCVHEGCTPPVPLRGNPAVRVLVPNADLRAALQRVDRRAGMQSPAKEALAVEGAASQGEAGQDTSRQGTLQQGTLQQGTLQQGTSKTMSVVPVYVIDPNGFLILRYPPGADPGGLRADLAKLLRLM